VLATFKELQENQLTELVLQLMAADVPPADVVAFVRALNTACSTVVRTKYEQCVRSMLLALGRPDDAACARHLQKPLQVRVLRRAAARMYPGLMLMPLDAQESSSAIACVDARALSADLVDQSLKPRCVRARLILHSAR